MTRARKIETTGVVAADGTLTVRVPGDVRLGTHTVVVVLEDVSADDLAAVAQHGGAFDWLHDEPDLYSEEEAVDRPRRPLRPRSERVS